MSCPSYNITSSRTIRNTIGEVNFLLALPIVLISIPFIVWYTPQSVYTVLDYSARAVGEALGYYHDSFARVNEHMEGKPLFFKAIVFPALVFALVVNSVVYVLLLLTIWGPCHLYALSSAKEAEDTLITVGSPNIIPKRLTTIPEEEIPALDLNAADFTVKEE